MFKLMLVMTLGIPVLGVSGEDYSLPEILVFKSLKPCRVFGFENWYHVGPYCARHFLQKLSFGEAEALCMGEHENGHLIAVPDHRTNDDLIILTSRHEAWIGGLKIPCTSDGWMWTDGSRWNYEKWVPGEPNGSGDCVQINWPTPGMFDDTKCCHKKSFVCAFPALRQRTQNEIENNS